MDILNHLEEFWEENNEFKKPSILLGREYTLNYGVVDDSGNIIRFADPDGIYLCPKKHCKIKDGYYDIAHGYLLRISCVKNIEGEVLDPLIKRRMVKWLAMKK